jgi:hypothetical protein
MRIDEIIDQSKYLVTENRALREKNMELLRQMYGLEASLDSVLNILNPDQLRIIKNDLVTPNSFKIKVYA